MNETATFNEKAASLQRKGGLECAIEGEGDERKVTVTVDDQYTFSKMVKPNLEVIVNDWDPELTVKDSKFSNHICLIIKIMMNKANMNPGIS